MSSANFNIFKEFYRKLWEFINLILILILIFSFFVNTGPVYFIAINGFNLPFFAKSDLHISNKLSTIALVFVYIQKYF